MPDQSMKPTPRPGVMDIAAYVPGKDHVEGVAKVYKLSSNETPLGPSPKAIEAMRNAGENRSLRGSAACTCTRPKRLGLRL